MDTNPYAAPGAVVEDAYVVRGNDLEARKASRAQRFGAAFLDGIILGIGSVPVSFYAMQYMHSNRRLPFAVSPTWFVIGMVITAIVCIINYRLIASNGQTIGKRAVGIKTVRSDGGAVTVPRVFFLRYLPVTLAGLIPLIGGFIGLIDACMIFGGEKRCLHDLIADTIVITA